MKTPEQLTEAFRARGLKVTPQRQAIFAALAGNTSHPTAESVYAAVSAHMPTISLRTVYQTLNDLAEMRELNHVHLGTGSSRFDPNLVPHHHLVCNECGQVTDVHTRFDDLGLDATEAAGYALASTEIVFRGVCPACQRTAPQTSPSPTRPSSGEGGPPRH
jgi:Fe2+ or Zn2+ uptake regulation protein